MKFTLPKIYPITDGRSHLSHAQQVEEFARGGAALVQVRYKGPSSREFLQLAEAAVEAGHRLGIKVMVNDRADIARMAGADGVHLGQDDLPTEAARAILGPEAIIGVSTHSIEQVRAAAAAKVADHVAFGPVFATPTKRDHEPPVGLDGIGRAKMAAGDLPLVAIGGITMNDLAAVLRSGADSVAMISEFHRPPGTLAARFQLISELAGR